MKRWTVEEVLRFRWPEHRQGQTVNLDIAILVEFLEEFTGEVIVDACSVLWTDGHCNYFHLNSLFGAKVEHAYSWPGDGSQNTNGLRWRVEKGMTNEPAKLTKTITEWVANAISLLDGLLIVEGHNGPIAIPMARKARTVEVPEVKHG